MASIFGRKSKAEKSRQSSISGLDLNAVPYDRLGPSPRSPVPVSTVSQGLRNGAAVISAPITNPTLTANGTEFNLHAMQRTKAERDRAYTLAKESNARPASPTMSVSTTDSATLYNDSSAATISGRPKTPSSRQRRSELSSGNDKRSPSMTELGHYPSPTSPYPAMSPSSSNMRPVSAVTSRSDGNSRGSRYASSLTLGSGDGSHSHFPHLSQHFYHQSRHGNQDDFNFPRPDNDDDIEILFENVKRTRGIGEMPNLSIEQKWHMVYNDEHIRWEEERKRDGQAKKQNETGQPAAIVENTPEWYIKKFLDKTISAKQAGSLLVSLRSKEMRCISRISFTICGLTVVQLVSPFYIYTRDICASTDSYAHQSQGELKVYIAILSLSSRC